MESFILKWAHKGSIIALNTYKFTTYTIKIKLYRSTANWNRNLFIKKKKIIVLCIKRNLFKTMSSKMMDPLTRNYYSNIKYVIIVTV